jgi:hypothetical protein
MMTPVSTQDNAYFGEIPRSKIQIEWLIILPQVYILLPVRKERDFSGNTKHYKRTQYSVDD